MAGASLFALLDDIARVLDDVAILTKVATQKTAGVLGDDLALNAQQVSGVRADRELPVVWAVAKGSLINKAILVPAAIAISAVAPWAIVPLLMLGGVFLCYEGVEKIWHKLSHRDEEAAHREELVQALENPAVDLRTLVKDKIKGAIRTDFILSATATIGLRKRIWRARAPAVGTRRRWPTRSSRRRSRATSRTTTSSTPSSARRSSTSSSR